MYRYKSKVHKPKVKVCLSQPEWSLVTDMFRAVVTVTINQVVIMINSWLRRVSAERGQCKA